MNYHSGCPKDDMGEVSSGVLLDFILYAVVGPIKIAFAEITKICVQILEGCIDVANGE